MESNVLGQILTVGRRETEDELADSQGGLIAESGSTPLTAFEHPEIEIWGDDQIFEFTTKIRDKVVRCFWSDKGVSGDEELLNRIHQALPDRRWTQDPIAVAHAVSSVVIYPVHIAVLPNPEPAEPEKLPSTKKSLTSVE